MKATGSSNARRADTATCIPCPNITTWRHSYRDHYHRVKQHIAYQAVDDAFVAKRIKDLQANREFRHIGEKVETFVPVETPCTMIDIGRGNNLLARFFMDRGWDCRVVEPNGDAADYLRQFHLRVVESMFEDVSRSQSGSYSFINLQFVLEHVLNPLDMLYQSIGMLNAGGLMRVCVPNDFSPGQMAWLGKTKLEPPWIELPRSHQLF